MQTETNKLTGDEAQVFYLQQLYDYLLHESAEGVMLTDNNGHILAVNASFSQITGFSAAEVNGKKTAILRSDHHPKEFYQQLWHSILHNGRWQGVVWNRRKDCSVYPQSLKIRAVYNRQHAISHYIALLHDLTQQTTEQAQQHRVLSTLDRLTGLGNRDMLVSRFSQQLAQSRDSCIHLYIIWIDGGQLASVIQQFGLTNGDRLLQQQAQRLQQWASAQDTLVRLYADDYIILKPAVCPLKDSYFDSLIKRLAQPVSLGNHDVTVAPAIGVSCYPADGEQEEQLLYAAETAMLDAKSRGANCWCLFNSRQSEANMRRHMLKLKLTEQLQGNPEQLQLYFQPKVSLTTGKICGAEALIRWNLPGEGWVSPAELISIAEQSRLIIALDRWVVTEVCRILYRHLQQNICFPLLSFNISAKQLNEDDFADWLKDCLAGWGLHSQQLEMEVTESAFVDNEAEAINLLRRLQQTGLRIALDDFGTGYSSLSYLKDMPLNTVKIDRSLISDITTNQRAHYIVRNLTLLAADLALSLVVEGVETTEQHQLLQQLGCQQAQGYYYARPLPEADFIAMLS